MEKDDIPISNEAIVKLREQLAQPCAPGANFDKLCGIIMTFADILLALAQEVRAKK